MAIWQFVVELVPIEWAEKHSYDAHLLRAEEGYECEVAWLGRQQEPNYHQVIGSHFAPATAWHEDLKCWGGEKSTDVQVWTKNGSISGIRIRIDVRNGTEATRVKAVRIAKELGCVFFLPESSMIIQADEHNLAAQMRASRASEFAADPKSFLEKKAV